MVAVLFLLLYAYQMVSVPPQATNTQLGAVSGGPACGRNTTLDVVMRRSQARHGMARGRRGVIDLPYDPLTHLTCFCKAHD